MNHINQKAFSSVRYAVTTSNNLALQRNHTVGQPKFIYKKNDRNIQKSKTFTKDKALLIVLNSTY